MSDSITGLLPDITTIYRLEGDWTEQITVEPAPSLNFLAAPGGNEELLLFSSYVPGVLKYKATSVNKGEEYDLIDFFCSRKGKLESFWVFGQRVSFSLVADALSGSDELEISPNSFDFQGYERIYIFLNDGSLIVRKIISASENVLTLDTPLDRDVTLENISIIGRLHLVRFNGDILNLSYSSSEVSSTTLEFIEVVGEYAEPTIDVLSPSGGEEWQTYENRLITWATEDLTGNLRIDIWKDGAFFETLAASVVDNGEWLWAIPEDYTLDANYRIRVVSLSNPNVFGESDADFEIVKQPETITILDPNGGEIIERESQVLIRWASTGFGGPVRIILYQFGVPGGVDLTLSTPNTGEWLWDVGLSPVPGTNYRIQIKKTDDFSVIDNSDANFSIIYKPRTITVLSPETGTYMHRGALFTFEWETTGFNGPDDLVLILLEWQSNPGVTWAAAWFGSGAPNIGHFDAVIPAGLPISPSNQWRCYMRRELATSGVTYDYSNYFTVVDP